MLVSSKINDLVNVYHENKLAHAFLLETNDLTQCYNDIISFIKIINCPNEYSDDCKLDCNLCTLIDSSNLPSLVVINPIGQNIKKEQILSMMEKFSTKPIYSKFNMYIINEADKLNGSSANTILKFLEEPEEGILGFFITNNAENVLTTIKSRCQVISCVYEENVNYFDDEVLDYVKIYLNSIWKSKDDLLYNKVEMVSLYKERKEWENFFLNMFYYVKECLEKKRNDIIELLKGFKTENYISMLLLIESIIKMVKSNVNIDLLLDKFVIEMRKLYE